MSPIIHTFRSETAPVGQCWIAFFFQHTKDKRGVQFLERLPIAFSAASEPEAVSAAMQWLSEEKEKEANRRKGLDAAHQARRAKSEGQQ